MGRRVPGLATFGDSGRVGRLCIPGITLLEVNIRFNASLCVNPLFVKVTVISNLKFLESRVGLRALYGHSL